MALWQLTDSELILRAKLEHPYRTDAFTEIVKRYEPLVYSFCHRLLQSAADAEDVSQNVFLRVFRGLPAFESRSSLKSWLMTIARNESTRRWSRVSRKREHEIASPEPAEGSTPAQTEAGLLDELLSKCTVESREVLLLRHVGGLSFSEISDTLGITLSAAKMRYQRALERLRKRHPDLTDRGTED